MLKPLDLQALSIFLCIKVALVTDQIEVGFSVDRGWQGRGFATEALRKVLAYLTENEGIPCVTAWCAAENIGSRRVLEKAGMELVHIDKDGLAVGDKTYDKLTFVYKAEHQQISQRGRT